MPRDRVVPPLLGLRLALRALRHRRGVSLAVLVVGVITTAVAAVGPFYARAGSESVLRDQLVAAPVADVGIAVQTLNAPADGALIRLGTQIKKTGVPYGYAAPIATNYVDASGAASSSPEDVKLTLVWRDGECAHLILVSGRCPSRNGDFLVSYRTLRDVRWRLGATVGLSGFPVIYDVGGSRVDYQMHGRIVGIYRARDPSEKYWFAQPLFSAHPGNGEDPPTIDAVFTAHQTFLDAKTIELGGDQFPLQLQAWNEFDYQVDPSRIRLDDEPRVRREVTHLVRTIGTSSDVQAMTKAARVLDRADTESHSLRTSVLLVTLQLALLAYLVLFLVVAGAAESRGGEVAVAKLRGHRAPRVAALALGEPLLLLALSLPLGVALGAVVVEVLAHVVLAPDTPVQLRLPPVLGGLAGFAGAVVAATAATAKILRRPVVAQWRRAERDTTGRSFAIVELVLAAVAIGVLAELAATGKLSSHRPSALALLVPGLLVLLAALVASRLLPPLCSWLAARSMAPGRGGRFLATRMVARRGTGARLAVLLGVAIGLATCAVDGTLVAGSNRAQRAATDVGASRVLDVDPPDGVPLADAVDRADPSGQWAMAVAEWLPFDGNLNGYVLGVEASRLAAVAHWRDDFTTLGQAALVRALDAPAPRLVAVADGPARVVATATAPQADVAVTLRLADAAGHTHDVGLGRLRAGTATYTGTVTGCSTPCRLAGVVLAKVNDRQFTEIRGDLTLTRLTVTGGGAAGDVDVDVKPSSWHAGYGLAGLLGTTAAADGAVRLHYAASGADSPLLVRATTPYPLPIAVNGTQATTPTGALRTADYDNVFVPLDPVAQVSVLPEVRDEGHLVELRYLERLFPHLGDYGTYQVWLSAAAPKDAAARLTANGIFVRKTTTIAARRAVLDRTGPALGLLLFAFAAIAAAVLAAVAVAVAMFVTARRRAFELAALLAVGLRRRTLLLAALGEQLFVLGTGLVVGVGAGLAAAAITLPSIPEFVDTPIPSLRFAPHPFGVAVFAVVLAVVVVATATVAAWGLLRAARPAVLREGDA